jgi:hypothetical protein
MVAHRYGCAVTGERFRCTACGNLTRFDVVMSRRTRAFHHYTVGGELAVEDEEILDESVEDVACRWCGTGEHVETVAAESATLAEDAT